MRKNLCYYCKKYNSLSCSYAGCSSNSDNMIPSDCDEFEETNLCPVCGEPMEETYLGRQYCYNCEKKYMEKQDE